MRAIGTVLLALLICVGFVVFFMAFLILPLLLLGVYVIYAIARDRRKRGGSSSPKPRRGLRRRSVPEGEAT
jgi:hypothetical protein